MMRKPVKLALVPLLSIPLITIGQTDETFTIHGKIDTIPNAKYRIMYKNNDKVIRDSLQLSADRTFTFRGSIGEPTHFNLIIDNTFNPRLVKDQIVYAFWVSPGDNLIFHGLTGWLSGSKDNLYTDESKYELKGSALDKSALDYVEKQRTLYLTDKDQDNKTRQVDSLKRRFIQNNPNSFYSLYLLNRSFPSWKDQPELLDSLYNGLSAQLKNSYSGILLYKKMMASAQLEIGKSLPTFELPNADGKLISLDDFKGKYVLVDFWASWCGPCRQEFPYLRSLYNEYRSKNFEILGISIDEIRKDWLQAVHDENLTWTNLSDSGGFKGELFQIFGLNGVPDNFLLDRNGKIVARNLRGHELKTVLEKLIAQTK
ncbi:redoxin domain-containing protein [Sphingobacterium thalpophilum]|uniref:redoxin domain-containing protein n=1 Tax=Sphingobacterium thalpophilum TaxID=259 RepID=UPI003C7877BE